MFCFFNNEKGFCKKKGGGEREREKCEVACGENRIEQNKTDTSTQLNSNLKHSRYNNIIYYNIIRTYWNNGKKIYGK